MSKDAQVEVVLINYKRPQNIPEIVSAFRGQSVKCHITLVDAAPNPEFSLPEDVRRSVDHLFTWNHEFGPYNRYVPIAVFSHEYTYFHDDDMLPGRRVIEHFTMVADSVRQFGVLGQMGRNVDETGAYIPREVSRTNGLVPVDLVVRGYFVRTRNLPAVIQLRHSMGLSPGVDLEDDLLLCTAMNTVHGLTNYLTPNEDDRETRINRSGLRSDFARFRRGNHLRERTDFCRKAMGVGWVPLIRRAEPAKADGLGLFHQSGKGVDSVTGQNQQIGKRQATIGAESSTEETANGGTEPKGKSTWMDFNVNDFWLKRGETYIGEKRLYTEPYQLQEDFILDALLRRAVPMGSILELGCGFGRVTKRLARTFPNSRIIAIDISPDQLENAREYCAEYSDRIEFLQYDFYSDDPFPGSTFDTAIAVEVFLHHPYEIVARVAERLSQVADYIVNYDRSEDRLGRVARHVWVHDYEEIYKRIGLKCKVFVEPQTFNGQQQKLFIASKKRRNRSDAGRDHKPGLNDVAASPIQEVDESLIEKRGIIDTKAPSNSSRLSMKRIEAKIPSDHAAQATLEYYLDYCLEAFSNIDSTVDILDLGCGTGSSFDKINSRFADFTWTGVDIADSPEVRSRTRTDCHFVTYDGINLPFDNDSFDLILSVQVFEHVRYPEQLLGEVSRVLRPGGLFVGSVSQLEPFHSNSLWNFTYYGFANIAHDAGLNLRELRPGIDGLTLTVRNILNHGFGHSVGSFSPFFKAHSPLHQLIKAAAGENSEDIQQINRLMLRYSGHFWFVFETPTK